MRWYFRLTLFFVIVPAMAGLAFLYLENQNFFSLQELKIEILETDGTAERFLTPLMLELQKKLSSEKGISLARLNLRKINAQIEFEWIFVEERSRITAGKLLKIAELDRRRPHKPNLYLHSAKQRVLLPLITRAIGTWSARLIHAKLLRGGQACAGNHCERGKSAVGRKQAGGTVVTCSLPCAAEDTVFRPPRPDRRRSRSSFTSENLS